MSHEVESMFYVREVPWHNLGTRVEDAPSSAEALKLAGLDWTVNQSPVYTQDMFPIPGYKANVRDTDSKVLGVVSDRYRVVQNQQAFKFVDTLLGEGVKFETAGSLYGGKRVWMLARMPDEYKVLGDSCLQYLAFSNSFDSTSGLKVFLTPVRIVCANTLAIALHDCSRIWSVPHTGDISSKINEARKTLVLADHYMDKLGQEASAMSKVKLPDRKVMEIISELIPEPENTSPVQRNNINRLRDDFQNRYFDAPDLAGMDKNAWRFLNAASDFCGHTQPLRKTENYQESLFARTLDGNAILDKAYEIVKSM